MLEWHRLGGHDPEVLLELAAQLRDAGRTAAAVPVMESLNWVMPYTSDVHRWLGEHYLDEQLPELALREFNALLGMQVDDPATAYLGRARAALQQNDEEKARREVLYSLERAPFYRPAQQLLLRLSAGE